MQIILRRLQELQRIKLVLQKQRWVNVWQIGESVLSETGEDAHPVSFANLDKAYSSLTDKLKPQVYELGFLK